MLCSDIKNQLEKAVITPLFQTSIIKIHGEEAEKFLQSQLTNNVTQAAIDNAQLQAYCNVKGRAHCVLRLLRNQQSEQSFYLLVSEEIAQKVHGILKMYLLRAKASVQIDNNLQAFMQINAASLPFLEQSSQYNVAGRYQRKLILVDNKNDTDKIAACEEFDDTIDYNRLHDIYSGIAQIYEASYDSYIPQFLNLDLTDGISFKKGCYPGQEIVARLRYLGKIKQRMIIAQSEAPCDIGDKVYNPAGKSIGTVCNSITTANAKTLLNIVINTDYLDKKHVLLLNNGNELLRIDMPYATPIEYSS